MLEISSHKSLKNFLRSNYIDWKHIYSFGRIISKCIQTNQNYLINSEIFLTDKWYAALLISLFLNEKDSFFVISKQEIHLLKKDHLKILKDCGFNFVINNNQLIFPKHKVTLVTLKDILKCDNDNIFQGKRIVLKDIQNLKEDIKRICKISLGKKDWFLSNKCQSFQNNEIQRTYDNLKQRFFSRAVLNQKKLYLYKSEIILLKEFFRKNESFSCKFSHVNSALSTSWASWINLNYENFEWELILEPIDEILVINNFLRKNFFVFLSAYRKDNFFHKYLKSHDLYIDLVINFKSDFEEKIFSIYIPPRLMLPNNPLFIESVISQIFKLFIIQKKFTLILISKTDLKINLATKLAAKFGHLVSLETFPKDNNSILVASYDWWIQNQSRCQLPSQIIIPIVPIPDIAEPINEQTISYHFKNSKDWFRDFLLPEAINKIDKAVLPLRKNSGSLVILDGRVSTKQWGRELIKKIQPSRVLNHMFPFE